MLLEDWVKQCCNRGLPLTKNSLLYSAHQLFQEGQYDKLVNTFDVDKGPSRRWYESFMRRHPNLTFRTPEYVHKGRAIVTETTIRKWFQDVCIKIRYIYLPAWKLNFKIVWYLSTQSSNVLFSG